MPHTFCFGQREPFQEVETKATAILSCVYQLAKAKGGGGCWVLGGRCCQIHTLRDWRPCTTTSPTCRAMGTNELK